MDLKLLSLSDSPGRWDSYCSLYHPLFIYPHTCSPTWLFIYRLTDRLPSCLPTYLPILCYLPAYLVIYHLLPNWLPTYHLLPTYLPPSLPACLPVTPYSVRCSVQP